MSLMKSAYFIATPSMWNIYFLCWLFSNGLFSFWLNDFVYSVSLKQWNTPFLICLWFSYYIFLPWLICWIIFVDFLFYFHFHLFWSYPSIQWWESKASFPHRELFYLYTCNNKTNICVSEPPPHGALTQNEIRNFFLMLLTEYVCALHIPGLPLKMHIWAETGPCGPEL